MEIDKLLRLNLLHLNKRYAVCVCVCVCVCVYGVVVVLLLYSIRVFRLTTIWAACAYCGNSKTTCFV